MYSLASGGSLCLTRTIIYRVLPAGDQQQSRSKINQ